MSVFILEQQGVFVGITALSLSVLSFKRIRIPSRVLCNDGNARPQHKSYISTTTVLYSL